MKKAFFGTVRFYSLIIIAIGALLVFMPFAASGFNLNFINPAKQIVRENNEEKIYTCDGADISLIQVDAKDTNVNIVPSKSNEFKITYFENISSLNIDAPSFVNIENVSCRNNVSVNIYSDSITAKCDLTNVSSEGSIKINTRVGEINLNNVSAKNVLDANSADGPINIDNVISDRMYFSSILRVSGSVCGTEKDYIIKKGWESGKEIPDIENSENKKILITSSYSDIKFTM